MLETVNNRGAGKKKQLSHLAGYVYICILSPLLPYILQKYDGSPLCYMNSALMSHLRTVFTM